MRSIFNIGFLFSVLVFGWINPILAVTPNVGGSYTGVYNQTVTPPPSPGGPPVNESGTITLTVSQNGTSVSGSGSQSDGTSFNFSGTVDVLGNTSGTVTTLDAFGNTGSGTYSGTFSGNNLNISYLTTDIGGFVTSGTANLTRPAIVSEEQDAQQVVASTQISVGAGQALGVANSRSIPIAGRSLAMRQNGGDNSGLDVRNLKFNIDGNQFSFGEIEKWLGYGQGGGAGDGPSIFGDKLGGFVTGNFAFGDHDRTSRESGFDFNVLGMTVGSDYRFTDHLIVGTAFTYAASDTNFDRSGGGSESDNYGVSLYSSYDLPGSFYLDGILSYGWSDYELDRNFTIGGVGQKAKADYDGIDYSVSLSSGYDFVFDAVSIQPFVRFDYIAVDIDSYQEKANSAGAAGSLLAVNQQSLQSLRTTLGGRASYAISTRYGVFVPTVNFEWQHEYKNNSRTVRTQRIGVAGSAIAVQTDSPDRNFFNLGAGVTGVFAQGISGFLSYDALLGNNFLSQHTVNVGVRMEF